MIQDVSRAVNLHQTADRQLSNPCFEVTVLLNKSVCSIRGFNFSYLMSTTKY